jgi:hypothetical protein
VIKLIKSIIYGGLVRLIDSVIDLFTLVDTGLFIFDKWLYNYISYLDNLYEFAIPIISDNLAFYDGTYHQIRVRINNVTATD